MWDLEMLFLTRIYYLKSASSSTVPLQILHLCAMQFGLLPISARESPPQISRKLCVVSLLLLRSLMRPTRRRSSTTSSGHCLTLLMRVVMSESKSSFSATSFPDWISYYYTIKWSLQFHVCAHLEIFWPQKMNLLWLQSIKVFLSPSSSFLITPRRQSERRFAGPSLM